MKINEMCMKTNIFALKNVSNVFRNDVNAHTLSIYHTPGIWKGGPRPPESFEVVYPFLQNRYNEFGFAL